MPGPANSAAARPVSTKMPVPMMQPMPSRYQVERAEALLQFALRVLGMHLRDGLADEQPAQPGGCGRGWRSGHEGLSGDVARKYSRSLAAGPASGRTWSCGSGFSRTNVRMNADLRQAVFD